MEITIATTEKDLQEIIALQKVNLGVHLSAEQKKEQGFVTVQHDLEVLTRMNESVRQIIAKDKSRVVGYALVMLREFSAAVPVLKPMFDMFGTLAHEGNFLSDYHYYVMGQICIDQDYRGQGLFQALYLKHKELYATQYDFCLTEVSTSNLRSMKAHHNMGFKIIHTFRDKTDEWNILLWDWN